MPRRVPSTYPWVRSVVLGAAWLTVLGCRSRNTAEHGPNPSSLGADAGLAISSVTAGNSDRGQAGDGGGARTAARRPMDGLGTVYPRDTPPHPRAARLCDVLHGAAARRKAECCGGEPTAFLAVECARVVAASLHAKTVAFDDAAVDRCAAAMNEALTGCDWVTPAGSPAPEACRGLLRGTLAVGSVCRSSLECEGNLHCEGVGPTKSGICKAPGGDGAACGSHVDVLSTYTLERDLATSHPFCAEFCSLTAHQCQPVPHVGDSCASSVNCAPSQICVAGRCSAAPPASSGESCASTPCGAGLRCHDKKCVALAEAGGACSSDFDCAKGGCVRGADGTGTCASKCVASLDVLRGLTSGAAMRLPTAPRAAGAKR